jgi:hypothetical protein
MAVAIPDSKTHVPVPRQASGWRRVLHTFLALAGWGLFAYWWWIVVHRVSMREVRFTGLFIAIAFVVCIAVTGLWVMWNVSIYKRKGPRTKVRPSRLDYSHDPLGRTVQMEAPTTTLLEAPVIRITLDGARKSYRPMRPDGPTGVTNSRSSEEGMHTDA